MKKNANPSFVRRTVTAASLSALVFCTLSAIVLSAAAYKETQDHQEDLLEEVAGVLARRTVAETRAAWPDASAILAMGDDEFEERFLIDDDAGSAAEVPAGALIEVHTLHQGGRTVAVTFNEPLRPGYQHVTIDGIDLQIHLVTLRSGEHIAVAQRADIIFENTLRTALTAVLPIVILTLGLLTVLGILFRRTLRPIQVWTADINRRTGEDLAPVPTENLPSELLPTARAFNGLLARVDELRTREVRFIANAAHELRSPLAALSLQIERLERERNLSDDARKRLSAMRAGLDRLVRQVSQLLALKRAEAGMAEKTNAADTPACSDLVEGIGLAIETVFVEADAKHQELVVEGIEDLAPDEVPVLPMPPDDLFAVLRNLLENAVRYTPDGGRITVRLESRAPLRFAVEDTGPGIPPEERKRVFDPFYRVLGTGVTGTGLGLAIVRTLLARCGFEVRLETPASGTGLRVVVEGSVSRKP